MGPLLGLASHACTSCPRYAWYYVVKSMLILAAIFFLLVGNNLFLGFWTSESIPGFRQGDYMAVYAALGVAQGFFSFAGSFAFR
jgi:hypothetical protein